MTGFGQCTMACISAAHSAKVRSKNARPLSGSARCADSSLRSCPAQKTLPGAVITTTRTDASPPARSIWAFNSAITASDNALAGGLARVSRKVPFTCSARMGPCGSCRFIATTSAIVFLLAVGKDRSWPRLIRQPAMSKNVRLYQFHKRMLDKTGPAESKAGLDGGEDACTKQRATEAHRQRGQCLDQCCLSATE